MARRSRQHRQAIPGYHDHRPARDDRKRDHRKTRHATNQMLRTVSDPDEIGPLPVVRRTLDSEPGEAERTPERRRFRVWKTKFWKRRDRYQDMRAALDARWEEVIETEDEEDW